MTATYVPVRQLGHYLTAAVLVRLADEGARVALVLLALQRTSSATTGGALVAALLVPHVVAGPAVGLLSDRVRQPRWILATAALGFAATLACTAAGLGRMPLPVVIVVLLAGGCCGPALTGALSSQLPAMVPSESLPRVFGLDSLTYNLSGIAGPAIAALVSGISSPTTATYLLAGSAACGAVVLFTLPIPSRDSSTSRHRTQPLSAGVSVMLQDRVLGVVTSASSLGQLGLGALPVITAVLATRHHAPQLGGWLITAFALGGLLGSLTCTRWPTGPPHAPLAVMISLIGTGLPLATAGLASLPLTAALFTISGFFTGPLTGALFTSRQAHAPADVRAQIFTLGAGLKVTAAAAGAVLAGTVAATPTAVQLLLAASCPLLAGVLGAILLSVPRRQHRRRATATRQTHPEHPAHRGPGRQNGSTSTPTGCKGPSLGNGTCAPAPSWRPCGGSNRDRGACGLRADIERWLRIVAGHGHSVAAL